MRSVGKGLGPRVHLLSPLPSPHSSRPCTDLDEGQRDEKGPPDSDGRWPRLTRPPSAVQPAQDENPDGHARATRWKRRLRLGPVLLALLFLIAIFVPERARARVSVLYLLRESGFLCRSSSPVHACLPSSPTLPLSLGASVNLAVSSHEFFSVVERTVYLLRLVLQIERVRRGREEEEKEVSMDLYAGTWGFDNIASSVVFKGYVCGESRVKFASHL